MILRPRHALLVFIRFISIVCMSASAHFASAFLFPDITTEEVYHRPSGHYFITNLGEAEALVAGALGPGWVRTGYSFEAASLPTSSGCVATCLPVRRFYAPGPGTHMFTIDAA